MTFDEIKKTTERYNEPIRVYVKLKAILMIIFGIIAIIAGTYLLFSEIPIIKTIKIIIIIAGTISLITGIFTFIKMGKLQKQTSNQ